MDFYKIDLPASEIVDEKSGITYGDILAIATEPGGEILREMAMKYETTAELVAHAISIGMSAGLLVANILDKQYNTSTEELMVKYHARKAN